MCVHIMRSAHGHHAVKKGPDEVHHLGTLFILKKRYHTREDGYDLSVDKFYLQVVEGSNNHQQISAGMIRRAVDHRRSHGAGARMIMKPS